jgi:hypothetical protein
MLLLQMQRMASCGDVLGSDNDSSLVGFAAKIDVCSVAKCIALEYLIKMVFKLRGLKELELLILLFL